MALEAQLLSDSGPTEEQLTYTNTSGASKSITDHEVFAIATKAGSRMAVISWAETDVVTAGTCAANEVMQVLKAGRIRVPKDTSVAFTIGNVVYWDYSANKGSDAATANTMDDFVLGMCVKTAAAAATEVDVDLNIGSDAFGIGSSSSSSSSSSS